MSATASVQLCHIMILFPNAKINIGLDILRRRDDGYHDLETVMIPVPWTDILEIVPARGESDTLTCTGRPVNCPPEKNLVMKAIRALREVVDFPAADIYLEKIIPDGAGLGGGSADASFAITGVNSLFGLGLDKRQMAEVAARIGADCPFFIYNEPMLCTGTGTTLHRFPLSLPQPVWIAIVKPDVSVTTAEAYRGVHPAVPDVPLADRLRDTPFSRWQQVIGNDFEHSIFPAHPAIAAVKEELLGQGAAYSAMSGSGSAVYGIFMNDSLFKPLPHWDCYFYKELQIPGAGA